MNDTAAAQSAVTNPGLILDAIVEHAQPQASERWLEAACGSGLVSRRLAPLVDSVHGVDITPAMVELARREAAAAGLENAKFDVADATDTGLGDGTFDGAVTRFSVHHIAVPGRLFEELARVIRPGGRLVVVDHLADEDPEARAWSQELERLRDPSHWALITADRMRVLAFHAGFRPEREWQLGCRLDFEDWLARGTGDEAARALARRVALERPGGSDCFALDGADQPRGLTRQLWLGSWSRC